MNIVILLFSGIVVFYSILNIFKQNKKLYIYILAYSILLFLILFNRTTNKDFLYSDGKYIFNWLDLIFKNKIVFINIIGNIILFIPMGIIMKSLNVRLIEFLILILFIIFLIELTQYISKRGVFDISDIILNYIGCILGYILIRKRGERYE